MTIHPTALSLRSSEPFEIRVLSRGRHPHPHKGACLMELVGAIPGGPWTDHPACTPPVLAHLARTVNDHTTPHGRTRLARLIPYLITDPDPALQHRVDLEVTRTLLAAAEATLHPELVTTWADRLQHLAVTRDHPTRRSRRQLVAIITNTLRAVHDATAHAGRDTILRTLLSAAINAQRAVENHPPLTDDRSAEHGPETAIVILARLTKPNGADFYEVEAHVDLAGSPAWLRESWHRRTNELHRQGS